jgi:stage III sporulation protein AA
MVLCSSEPKVSFAVSLIGGQLSEEIVRIASGRRLGISGVREISLRASARSSVVIGEERIPLSYVMSRAEMEALVSRICEGALYAHRDSIASGFVSLKGGIRVGISGFAKYEHKSLVGVSDIRSLLFRIPGHACAFSDRLYEVFSEGIGNGMLIFSPPGVGKTTALRFLAKRLGTEINACRVAVVDERCEFDEQDYADAEVDILKGYKRRRGIEIATRTMSPDIIIIDEIGADDAEGISAVARCGIPIVATAHAGSYEELLSRSALYPLIGSGVFSVFVGIFKAAGEYSLTVDRR